MNHFEVFGLAPGPDLDLPGLEQKLRALALEHHPDRAPAGDARARLRALERTTALNDAFKVLKDPVRRAVYLLKLKGVDLETDGPGRYQLPTAFLAEMLERREELEAATAKRDEALVQRLAASIRAELTAALGKAQAALRDDDVPTAAAHLGRVRYFTRFLEEVDAFEEELIS